MKRSANIAALLTVLLTGSTLWADPELGSDNLRREIRELKDEVASLRRKIKLDNELTNTELRLLNERMERIERSLTRLTPTTGTQTTTSRFTPGAATTGIVRLDNRLGVTATVTLDGTQYTVPPLSQRIIRGVPAGTITYEVTAVGYGVRAPVRTPVNSNETLTLTIF